MSTNTGPQAQEAGRHALPPAQKALRRIRAVASEPRTITHHGPGFVEGMRRAANLLEEAICKPESAPPARVVSDAMVDAAIAEVGDFQFCPALTERRAAMRAAITAAITNTVITHVSDTAVAAALDAQPFIAENDSVRVWQFIQSDRRKEIMRAALLTLQSGAEGKDGDLWRDPVADVPKIGQRVLVAHKMGRHIVVGSATYWDYKKGVHDDDSGPEWQLHEYDFMGTIVAWKAMPEYTALQPGQEK